MNELSPSAAAAIARGAYRLRDDSVSTVRERGQDLGCEEHFNVDDEGRFEGRSGGLAWKSITGFGYVASGKGAWQGDLLVATRGTAMKLDWLSNFNIGLQMGPGGMPVHAGFNEVWKSFAPELRNFLRNRNPTRIHCVGHSLGGALAALNADLLSAGHVADVVLYTFGAPRTGDGLFARSLTQRIGAAQIHRVSHPADPVPMIPLFPFWHLPFGCDGLGIAKTSNALVSVGAHSMASSYIPGVADHGWATLGQGGAADDERRTKSWLEQAAEGHGGFVMGSAALLTMIGKALRWLLEQAGRLVMGTLGTAITATATVLDQLAWLLARAAQLSKEVGGHVKTLIGAIFGFLGRKAAQAGDVTVAFLRWLLELLFGSLRAVALRALSFLS